MGRTLHRASASSSASSSASIITLSLAVGCAPSCWPIFGFRNFLGARRGAEGSFLCSPSSRFSGRGGGVGSPPGRGGELGCLVGVGDYTYALLQMSPSINGVPVPEAADPRRITPLPIADRG